MQKKYLGPLGAITATGFALDVHAAVPTAVTDAITTGGADAVTVGVAVFVALIGVYAVKMMRKGL